MTLGNLLYEIRSKYAEVSAELKPYIDIPEVESFLSRRGEDLKEFEWLVSGYRTSELIGVVINSLREKGVEYKIYGICSKGEKYFEVTKKVKKAIEQYEKELLRQACEKEEKSQRNYDADYAIPDELSEEEMAEVFTEE